MPELKPLPCPACGSEHTVVAKNFSPWFTAGSHVLCVDCQMQGPTACSQREEDATTIEDLREMIEPTGFEAAAITAFNALPRALTWTTEPPKVEGWYWCRLSRLNMARCVEVYGSEDGLRCGSGDSWQEPSMPFEWAGPIAPPID